MPNPYVLTTDGCYHHRDECERIPGNHGRGAHWRWLGEEREPFVQFCPRCGSDQDPHDCSLTTGTSRHD
jgi:hypothetical protein